MKIKTISQITNLKYIQKANQFFYFLSHAFIFKRFFHEDLVKEYISKEGIILAIKALNFFKNIINKIIYIIFLYLIFTLSEKIFFGHLFITFTIISRSLIEYNREDYNNVILMHIDPIEYTKIIYHKYIIGDLISFMIVFVGVAKYFEMNYLLLICLLFIYLAMHFILEMIRLILIKNNNYILLKGKKNHKFLIIRFLIVIISLIFAINGYIISDKYILLLGLIIIPLGIYAYFYIFKNIDFHKIYRYNLTIEKINEIENIALDYKDGVSLNKMKEELILNDITSDKKGYEYLFEAFKIRYKKSFEKGMKIKIILITLFGLFSIIFPFIMQNFEHGFTRNEFTIILLNRIYVLMYFIYLFSQGSKHFVTSCFLQIDRYLINYHFFRKAQGIAENFKMRLLSVIKITMIPTLYLMFFILLSYLIHTNHIEFSKVIIIIIFPIVLGLFYSVYTLAAYYLFQPFSEDGTIVNKAYGIVNYIVYIISYVTLNLNIGLSISILILLILFFAIISLLLYFSIIRIGPKKFRVR